MFASNGKFYYPDHRVDTMTDRYLIKERSEADIQRYGSIEKTLQALKTELEEMQSLWSMHSSDSLGHGITCTKLKIRYIEGLRNK